MRTSAFAACLLSALLTNAARGQAVDTLVDVGGHRLHFHIVPGHGIPILFEAGGGDGGAVWDSLLGPIARATGAPLITYDRAGFGTSEIDTAEHDIAKHGILAGIKDLEVALRALGYGGAVMLVAHSYGGLYATLYANRHPSLVKAAVLIDASTACWFNDAFFRTFVNTTRPDHPGAYYQSANLRTTVAIVRSAPFPSSIPVIDLVSAHPPFSDSADIVRWRDCHKQFAGSITVPGTSHYIYRDNPRLVIDEITKTYARVAPTAAIGSPDVSRRRP
jgi:hypothetical protein